MFTNFLFQASTKDFSATHKTELNTFLEGIGTSKAMRKLVPEKKRPSDIVIKNFQKLFNSAGKKESPQEPRLQTKITKTMCVSSTSCTSYRDSIRYSMEIL
jgi:hypothetical protein